MNRIKVFKHIFAVLLIILMAVSSSFAQSKPLTGNDPEATKMLEKIKKEYQKHKTIETVFDVVTEYPGSKAMTQSGKLIQQGKKYAMVMSDQEVYCDGKNVWYYLKDDKEVQVNNFDDKSSEEVMSPEQLLRFYENGNYLYAITGEEKIGTKNLTNIEFKPKSRMSQYSKVRIGVDNSNGMPNYIKVFSKNGAKMTLVIKSTSYDKLYKPDAFVFNEKKYPGIHVEDLRID
ncbi:MAG: outer membrane lipoprotein carrier protein LolA [Saprospiraceae bacterium]|nr:outer membrane lipoprotein carrier protein LolA [Saprospiraceae bacterium]